MLSDGYYSGIIRGNLIFLVSYSLTVLSPSALINDTHWRICYFIIWFPTQQTSCQGCKMLPADWLPVTRLSWMKKKAFQLIRKKNYTVNNSNSFIRGSQKKIVIKNSKKNSPPPNTHTHTHMEKNNICLFIKFIKKLEANFWCCLRIFFKKDMKKAENSTSKSSAIKIVL